MSTSGIPSGTVEVTEPGRNTGVITPESSSQGRSRTKTRFDSSRDKENKITVDDRRGSNEEDVSMLERGGLSDSMSEKEFTRAVGREMLPGEVLHNYKHWMERILPNLCQNIQCNYYSITLSETLKNENGTSKKFFKGVPLIKGEPARYPGRGCQGLGLPPNRLT